MLSRSEDHLLTCALQNGACELSVLRVPEFRRVVEFELREAFREIVYIDFSPCENYILVIGTPYSAGNQN